MGLVPTQNEILKKALKKLLAECYAHKLQHKEAHTKTAMDYAEAALNQPKIKVLPCRGHAQASAELEEEECPQCSGAKVGFFSCCTGEMINSDFPVCPDCQTSLEKQTCDVCNGEGLTK